MAIQINNFLGKNPNIEVLSTVGPFTIIKHIEDLSVAPATAQTKYFMSQMGCCLKQVMVQLNGNNGVKLSPGAMQFMTGNIEMTSGVKGLGDLVGKMVGSKMTGNAPIKPEYTGMGVIMCEPTYWHFLTLNVEDWGAGVVCDDGMFEACELSVQEEVVMRQTLSSAVGGKEGLFNSCLSGHGIAVLKSRHPVDELYEVVLNNDCIKIDGPMACCWSKSLQFTVERSGKSLMGSAASGEGLVNVYRGTGKILMSPNL